MKMYEAKIKGSMNRLGSFRVETEQNGLYLLRFLDNGNEAILEGYRGGNRQFKTIENLISVAKEINPHLESIKVIL